MPQTDVRIFGKPIMRPHRRMGVALSWGDTQTDIKLLVEKAKTAAAKITLT
jgi:phosphoribosylglycinamide formyltransferase 2